MNELSLEEAIIEFAEHLSFANENIPIFRFKAEKYNRLKKAMGCILDEREDDSSQKYINLISRHGAIRIYSNE